LIGVEETRRADHHAARGRQERPAQPGIHRMPRPTFTARHRRCIIPLLIEFLFPQFERILMAGKQLTKSEILNSIAGTTELSRKQVASVIDALGELAKKNVGKKGPGVFVLSGLLKIVAIQKPAVPAHKGINPFTKQEQMFKAKPARKVIKVRALKALKDAVK
jgi:nucleoid DNA-binding protein